MLRSKKSISVDDIESMLNNINLIDIREPYEYSSGHLPTAKNVPMDEIVTAPEEFLDKEDEYYIICQSGGRSSRVCSLLEGAGYKVINVNGGTGSYRGNLQK